MSAAGQIKSFVDRVLRLKEEQDTIGQDIRDVYAEAKSMGLDKTQLGNVVSHVRKVEKKGRDAINEGNAIFDMYLAAYEGSHAHAPARARENIEEFPADKGVEVGVDTPHDPETGEILESVHSHEALVLSAPAESAPGEISATNQESGGMKLAVLPSFDPHEADESGSPIQGSEVGEKSPAVGTSSGAHDADISAPLATVAQRIEPPASNREVAGSNPASGSNQESAEALDAPQSAPAGAASDKAPAPEQPAPTPQEGADGHPRPSPEADEQSANADGEQAVERPGIVTAHSGQEPGGAAQGGNPVASASEPSVTFDNPRCREPKSCHLAHSRDCCLDCSIAYGRRPKEEQVRLWQEAIGAAA